MAVTVVVALSLIAAACGDDGGSVEATDAWARTSPMVADAGAVYMNVASDEAVSIVSARVPADVAEVVELHETVMADHAAVGDDAMEGGDGIDDDAMEMPMVMQEVTSVDIPAGGSVSFEPGGLHVMLTGLAEPLETGDRFEVTLVLETGDEVLVDVEVRETAP